MERRDDERDVYDRHLRIDLENDALERADQMVVGAVVSRERDDRVGQWMLSFRIVCAGCARGVGRHSASINASEGARWRQEIAWRLLCNRQRSALWQNVRIRL